MSNSACAEHRVTVKESEGNRPPFLAFELAAGDEIPALTNALITLRLQPGTTYAQAQELARHMNEHAVGLSLTTL